VCVSIVSNRFYGYERDVCSVVVVLCLVGILFRLCLCTGMRAYLPAPLSGPLLPQTQAQSPSLFSEHHVDASSSTPSRYSQSSLRWDSPHLDCPIVNIISSHSKPFPDACRVCFAAKLRTIQPILKNPRNNQGLPAESGLALQHAGHYVLARTTCF
jgi:hypothetical protein